MILSRSTRSFYMLTCIFDVYLGRIPNIAAFGRKLYKSKKIVHGYVRGDAKKVFMGSKNASYNFYTQISSIYDASMLNSSKIASKFVFLGKIKE